MTTTQPPCYVCEEIQQKINEAVWTAGREDAVVWWGDALKLHRDTEHSGSEVAR